MNVIHADRVLSQGNILGEGPFLLAESRLAWFDIFGKKAFMLNLSNNEPGKDYVEVEIDNFLCCAGLTDSNDIIAAGAMGVGILDNNFRMKRILFSPPFDTEQLRFNDGKVGPDGALWAGVMTYEGNKPIGTLLRFTDRVECVLEKMLIPNGLGWSPDKRTMYITDTGFGKISKWDFNPDTGAILNERPFISSANLSGAPDGLAVDSEGNIWSAFWGSGLIRGFEPSGKLFAEIMVHAENPTSCCFGGVDSSTLFITSARHGVESPGEFDGAVFAADTGTRGKPSFEFKYY